jgi:UDP-N-acetylmuramate dehydrogenase
VSDAVIAIRSSKLPDPKELGNSGSFFKNPEISIAQLNELKVQFPLIPSYPTREGFAKVPAGWLIENAGWKGRRVGNTGSHAKQALVLVNYGEANGQEVLNLAQAIIEDVEAKYGIRLVPEVNIL